MSEVHACTVITRNRLAHARVLARSFLEHHPGGTITALLVDDVDREVNRAAEVFGIVHPEDTGLDRREFHRMATMYDALELSCALKVWMVSRLLDTVGDAVLYLDSDIEVFDSLEDVVPLARAHSLVLTPHLTEPPFRPGTGMEERGRLLGGIFNLGFLAVSEEARPFLAWWGERVARYCLNRPEAGYFVDQRWVDLAAGYFEHYVLRDPGYNVAAWNVITRDLERHNGRFLVDGVALRFYHFGGFDPELPYLLSRWLLPHPHTLLSQRPVLRRMCSDYAHQLYEHGYEECQTLRYGFDSLRNGRRIDTKMRSAYRQALLEAERLGKPEPPNPFERPDSDFLDWLWNVADGPDPGEGVSPEVAADRWEANASASNRLEGVAASFRDGQSAGRPVLRRLLRPYTVRRAELDEAIVDSMRGLAQSQTAMGARIAEVAESLSEATPGPGR